MALTKKVALTAKQLRAACFESCGKGGEKLRSACLGSVFFGVDFLITS